MDWYTKLINWLRGVQTVADQATKEVGKAVTTAGQAVDKVAHEASDKIKEVMKPVDELGAKIGGTGGRRDLDGGR